jgi:ABC-type multidrug transport system ATPase subunit
MAHASNLYDEFTANENLDYFASLHQRNTGHQQNENGTELLEALDLPLSCPSHEKLQPVAGNDYKGSCPDSSATKT